VPSFTKQKVASTSRFLYNVPSTGLQLTIQCDWYTFHVRSCFFSFFFVSVSGNMYRYLNVPYCYVPPLKKLECGSVAV
jgi:hypothetical protein